MAGRNKHHGHGLTAVIKHTDIELDDSFMGILLESVNSVTVSLGDTIIVRSDISMYSSHIIGPCF